MKEFYSQFLREKQYLNNVSPRTVKYQRWVFNIWDKHIGAFPDKQNVKEFVMKLVEQGLSTFTVNSYIRGMNSFLSWLHENEHTAEHLKIKKIKEGQKALKVFSEDELKRILAYKPKTFAEKRVYTIICLMLDTGIRIEEALGLRRGNIDLDNLLVSVVGKGNKERVIPFSIECCKTLFKFMRLHDFDLVFPTVRGEKISYRTALDQLKILCEPLGISASWHKFRHTFASLYVRDGGNVIYLSRTLGHTDLRVTQIYGFARKVKICLLVESQTSTKYIIQFFESLYLFNALLILRLCRSRSAVRFYRTVGIILIIYAAAPLTVA